MIKLYLQTAYSKPVDILGQPITQTVLPLRYFVVEKSGQFFTGSDFGSPFT